MGSVADERGHEDPAHRASRPPIPHPPPVRASGWNKLFAREGWTCLLVLGDLLASLAAVLVALVVTDASGLTGAERLSLFAFCLLVPALLYVRGVYRRRVRVALHDVAPMIGAVSVAAMAVVTWDVAVLDGTAVSPVMGRTWLLTFPLLIGTRSALSLLRRRARARGLATRNTLIVGAGEIGATVAQRLAAQPEYGLRPVGFLDDDPPGIADGLLPVLGSPYDLDEVARTWSAEHVVFAFAYERDQRLMPLVSRCEELGLEVSLVPRLFESINDRAAFDWVGSLPLLGVRPLDPKGWQFRLKYALDRPLAAVRPDPARAGDGGRGAVGEAQLAGTGPVPPAAHRPGRPGLRDAQVPLDGDRRPSSFRSSRSPASRRAASRGPTGAPRSGASCAAARSTSCPSSSTCSGAR